MLAASCLFGLAGCVDLPLVPKDVCGNHIVEETNGEDCDGIAGCEAPGKLHACRYRCTPPNEDVAPEERLACPPAYGCGVDGVCRQHSGAFEVMFADTSETARDMLLGDIDGDGCTEVVRTTPSRARVVGFESRSPGLCPATESSIELEDEQQPAPVLVDLTEYAPLDLVAAEEGPFGAGLSVYVSGVSASLASALYPIEKMSEPNAKIRRMRLHGQDALLVLLGAPGILPVGPPATGPGPFGGCGGPVDEVTTTTAAVVTDPRAKSTVLADALPFALDGIAALAVADLDASNLPDEERCDEVAIARRTEGAIQLYRLCAPDGTLVLEPLPDVHLDGATIHDLVAVMALADKNGDGFADLITNTKEGAIQIAYGLGDGRFHSQPPPVQDPDQKMSALVLPDPGFQESPLFVAADFDPSTPGDEVVSVPCGHPGAPFVSPLCGPIPGTCEAIVADVDADGDPDIVSLQGQQPDVTVRRLLDDGSFHTVVFETQCSPHNLTAGDVDGDGVTDVAFVDQASATEGTTLKVAYGNAYAAPSEAVEQGRYSIARGLASGHFVPDLPGDQLVALGALACAPAGLVSDKPIARSLIAGESARLLRAPFYFPSESADSSVLDVTFRAVAAGRFATSQGDAGPSPAQGLVVLTEEPDPAAPMGKARRLRLVTGSSADLVSQLTAEDLLPCDDCVLAALAKGEGQHDDLLLLGDGEIGVFEATAEGFAPKTKLATAYTFVSVERQSSPPRYVPRPLTADLDRDGRTDIVAARAKSGDLVALWPREDGGFDETVLRAKPECDNPFGCPRLVAAALNLDGDTELEMAILEGNQITLFDVDPSAHSLSSLGVIPLDDKAGGVPEGFLDPTSKDFAALGGADMDGDGVDDLVVMLTSTYLQVLRGVPVHE